MAFSKRQHYSDGEQISGCQVVGEKGRCDCKRIAQDLRGYGTPLCHESIHMFKIRSACAQMSILLQINLKLKIKVDRQGQAHL